MADNKNKNNNYDHLIFKRGIDGPLVDPYTPIRIGIDNVEEWLPICKAYKYVGFNLEELPDYSPRIKVPDKARRTMAKRIINMVNDATVGLRKKFGGISQLSLGNSRAIVAGGAVIRELIAGPRDYEAYRGGDADWGAWFGDADIFIYGPDDEDPVRLDMLRLIGSDLRCQYISRSEFAISFSPGHSHRARSTPHARFIRIDEDPKYSAVQIVLGKAYSIGEIINSFDIDCCCFAFDGTDIWCLPRGLTSVYHRAMWYWEDKGTHAYEYRLWKYIRRKFSLIFPMSHGLSPEAIDFSWKDIALSVFDDYREAVLREKNSLPPSVSQSVSLPLLQSASLSSSASLSLPRSASASSSSSSASSSSSSASSSSSSASSSSSSASLSQSAPSASLLSTPTPPIFHYSSAMTERMNERISLTDICRKCEITMPPNLYANDKAFHDFLLSAGINGFSHNAVRRIGARANHRANSTTCLKYILYRALVPSVSARLGIELFMMQDGAMAGFGLGTSVYGFDDVGGEQHDEEEYRRFVTRALRRMMGDTHLTAPTILIGRRPIPISDEGTGRRPRIDPIDRAPKEVYDDTEAILNGKQGKYAKDRLIEALDQEIADVNTLRSNLGVSSKRDQYYRKAIADISDCASRIDKNEWLSLDLGPVAFLQTVNGMKAKGQTYMTEEQRSDWFGLVKDFDRVKYPPSVHVVSSPDIPAKTKPQADSIDANRFETMTEEDLDRLDSDGLRTLAKRLLADRTCGKRGDDSADGDK